MGFGENLKSELDYAGLTVKELAAKSGVKKYSIDNYLNKRRQMPSADAAVKIARILHVSVEYLIGDESPNNGPQLSDDARTIGRLADQLNERERRFVLDFVKWLKTRQ